MSLKEDWEYNEAVVQTENNDMQWCLVGKFLTEKPINFMYMKNTMTGLWRSVRGMCIKDVDQNLFLFQFYHHLDMNRVIRDGQWTFDQHLLLLNKPEHGQKPQEVKMSSTSFWVQGYDFPCGFMSRKVAKDIRNFIKNFLEADPNNFTGSWRNYLHIRVSIDVKKPLVRKMQIKKAGATWSWISFKYERLPTFCFFMV